MIKMMGKMLIMGHVHSQKKWHYYSYIGSYLKPVRVIAGIWNSILCFYNSSEATVATRGRQSVFIYSTNSTQFSCEQFLL